MTDRVVKLGTGKPVVENENQEDIISLLQMVLQDAKDGLITDMVMYIRRQDGFHRSVQCWTGSLKALGMAEMLKYDIQAHIHAKDTE